jgi:hypothetical protein
MLLDRLVYRFGFMITNGKQRVVTALEAELVRLNALVRERRKQLDRLEKCPNKDCPCRFVWREHVEKNLAGQVGKIRRHVRSKPLKLLKPKRRARQRSGKRNTPRRLSRGQDK